jgi:hypothetical protein
MKFPYLFTCFLSVSLLCLFACKGRDETIPGINDDRATHFTNIVLEPPRGDGTSQTFFTTNTGITQAAAIIGNDDAEGEINISGVIDFGYFYGVGQLSYGATLASPAEYPIPYGQDEWAFQNETRFKRTPLTGDDFANIDLDNTGRIDNIFEINDFGPNEGMVTHLEPGEVIAFETDPNKLFGRGLRGLIYVADIVGGAEEGGEIHLEIVINP